MWDMLIVEHKDALTKALDITAESGIWTMVSPASKLHRDCNPEIQMTSLKPSNR